MAGLAGHQRRGTITAFAAALILLLLAPVAARAQLDDVFTVRVPVDKTADTASNARAQALADGQRLALRRVFERIVLAEDMSRLPRVNDRTIEGLVQAFEVDKERTSPVRYLAELTIRFKAADIRNMLQQANLRFAETRSRPVVVLPVLREGQMVQLWEETNAWRRAWAEMPTPDGLVPIIVPIGDLTDADAIDASAAAWGNKDKLNAIMQRYRAGEVIVAIAELPPKAQPRAGIKLTATRHGTALGEAVQGLTPETGVFRAAGTPEEQLTAAARDMAQRIETIWKRTNVLSFGQEQRLVVTLPLQNGLGDLVEARQRLADVPTVRRVEVNAFTRQMVRLIVTFSGEPQQLQSALAQRDMTLSADGADWLLVVARQPLPPSPGAPGPTASGPAAKPPGSQ
jgi:hypothetical protein